MAPRTVPTPAAEVAAEQPAPRLAAADLHIDIDLEALDVGALIDLEEATKTLEMVNWLVKHTSLEMAQLRALPLAEFKPLCTQLAAEIKAALDPK